MNERSGLTRFLLLLAVSTPIAIVLGGRLSVEAFVATLIANGAMIAILAVASSHLSWKAGPRAVALFVLVFNVLVVNITIELVYFSTTPPSELFVFVLVGGVVSAAWTGVTAWLFPPDELRDVRNDLSTYFEGRSLVSWGGRVSLCVVAYLLLYFFVGAIAYQFTRPYYTDPSYGLNLAVPGIRDVVVAQLMRGPFFVASLIPLLAGISLSRGRAAILGGAALFVLGGLTPLVSNTDWPAALRFYHSVEVLFQNLPAGILIGWLMARAEARP